MPTAEFRSEMDFFHFFYVSLVVATHEKDAARRGPSVGLDGGRLRRFDVDAQPFTAYRLIQWRVTELYGAQWRRRRRRCREDCACWV
jgi:hypothetical protein